jgi:uncharacterized membrane protein YkoI
MTKKWTLVSVGILVLVFALWGSFIVKEHDKPPAEQPEIDADKYILSPARGASNANNSNIPTLLTSIGEDELNHREEYAFPLSDEDMVSIALEAFPFEFLEDKLEDKATLLREESVIRVFFTAVAVRWLPYPAEMEAVIDANTATVLDADIFQKSTNTVCDADWAVKVSDEEALSIAKSAIGKSKYNEILSIRIEHLEGSIIRVVFPFSGWRADTGYFYPGPDFAVEVLIDANSGEVLRVSG